MVAILENTNLAIDLEILMPAAQANQLLIVLAQIGKGRRAAGGQQFEDILKPVSDRFLGPEEPLKRWTESLDPELSIQEDLEGDKACDPSSRKVHRSAAARITHGGQGAASDA